MAVRQERFSRWKYAEEWLGGELDGGVVFKVWRDLDATYEEDGEHYPCTEYVVEWDAGT
jgi:hypothetical protein